MDSSGTPPRPQDGDFAKIDNFLTDFYSKSADFYDMFVKLLVPFLDTIQDSAPEPELPEMSE